MTSVMISRRTAGSDALDTLVVSALSREQPVGTARHSQPPYEMSLEMIVAAAFNTQRYNSDTVAPCEEELHQHPRGAQAPSLFALIPAN